jgi:hypothetical protein
MARLWHALMHRFGWFSGRIETWWDGDRLLVGLRCGNCGEVCGVDVIGTHTDPVEDRLSRASQPTGGDR